MDTSTTLPLPKGNCAAGPEDNSRIIDPEVAVEVLSQTLWSQSADDDLKQTAGHIKTYGDLRQVAAKMLTDARIHDRAVRYLRAFLSQRTGALLPTKDSIKFPDYDEGLWAAMNTEVDLLAADLLHPDSPSDIRAMLTAPTGYVNASLAAHYGVMPPAGTEFVRTIIPERFGVLTLAYFLTAHSGELDLIPPRLGAFVQASLLCNDLPAHATFTPQQPIPPGMTLREQWESAVLSPTACGSCHQHVTPIGFGFGDYDATGRFRPTSTQALVDTSFTFLTPNDEISFSGVAEMVDYLAKRPDVWECFGNFLYEFFLQPDGSPSRVFPENQENAELLLDIVACAANETSENWDIGEFAARLAASPLLQNTFSCGENRCLQDEELCHLFGDSAAPMTSCERRSSMACAGYEKTCSCSQTSAGGTIVDCTVP